MFLDGYNKLSDLKLEKFKIYSHEQAKVNGRLKEIAKEINELPHKPSSMDRWIESYTDLSKKEFSMLSYNKYLKISKEYGELVDKSENNFREMKIIFIEDLIDKINDTINNIKSE